MLSTSVLLGNPTGRAKQLYQLSRSDFRMPLYVGLDGTLKSTATSNIPLMFWPNGAWCNEANRFIRAMVERGLSLSGRGGSVAVAAASITHLLRFCWHERTDLAELSDNQFMRFINGLKPPLRPKADEKISRSNTRVIEIGRTCLSFLDSIGRHCNDENAVGLEGRIQASLRTQVIAIKRKGRGKGSKIVAYWHHRSFPKRDPKRSRSPISQANINLLREAIPKLSANPHLRIRRHVSLKLFESTGARVSEIAALEVKSVLDASRMEHPMLRLRTVKKRGGENDHRFVPISQADLRFVLDYIEYYRNPVVRRRLKGKADHGFVLISHRTGMPFKSGSLTQDVRLLRKCAGIPTQACPHMFRHRFVTKLFVALIQRHEIENAEEFRRLLIDGEILKRKISEWTGHTSLDSLDTYIDLAFEEITQLGKSYDTVKVNFSIDSFLGSLQAEMQQLADREGVVEAASRIAALVQALKVDLESTKS